MNARRTLIVTLLLVLPALAGCRSGEAARREKCLNNLLQINEPLNCCIPLERKLEAGAEIQKSDLLEYLRGGVLPRCPSGTEYRIAFVAGGRPVCPVHGDLLAGVTNVKVFGDKPIYPSEP
jgi:hypothetical protein